MKTNKELQYEKIKEIAKRTNDKELEADLKKRMKTKTVEK